KLGPMSSTSSGSTKPYFSFFSVLSAISTWLEPSCPRQRFEPGLARFSSGGRVSVRWSSGRRATRAPSSGVCAAATGSVRDSASMATERSIGEGGEDRRGLRRGARESPGGAPRARAGSSGALAQDHRLDRVEHDREVEEQRLVLDVEEVVLELLKRVLDRVPV